MSKFFSLAYLTLPNTHPVDQIEIAAQCGYEGVGLRTISQHLPGEPDYALANGRMFQMVRAALERTGVRLMDIELARVADGVDVMSYEKEFALGAELGAKYAIASVWSADRDFSRVQFEKMCDLADKYGMKCWTNAESFDRDMPIRFPPIKFDKLRLKLEAAKRAGYDKAITFEFSHFMSPQSAYLQAGHLYDRYKEYFEIE